MSDQELDEETRRQRAHLKELEDHVTREEREKESKRQKYMEEKERAAEQKRQQREKEKERERAKRGSNISQDGVLLVRGKGRAAGEDEDGEEGRGGKRGAGKDREEDGVPSDFSDESLSDDENVDLSKMTEEEREAYFAERERKRQLIEERRRATYGDKYDEVMKKKKAKKEAEAARKAEEQAREEERRLQEEAFNKAEEERKRKMSLLRAKDVNIKSKEKPKSMVTYDKGPPRWPQDKEKSELNKENVNLSHERRNSRTMTSESQRRASKGGEDLEGGKFLKLPPIKGQRGSFGSDDGGEGKGRRGRKMHPRGETIDRNLAKTIADEGTAEEDDNIEIGEDGKLRLKKGKKIDLSKLSNDMLKKLGIDPNMTAKEKAKMLKKLFGSDVMITEGSYVIGTKGIDEYDLDEVTDEMLAADMNLDLDTIHGQRRMNILFRRGGMLLREHMKKVIEQSKLAEDPPGFRNDLDERGGIDFMQHYRLVDPAKIEAYAKAFVVEDGDLDTVINIKEALTALDGVPGIQHMTSKQFDYVFKVLNIDDASQVTFRMFAVITALCERVTCME
ncbi:hypothetical protein PoB_004091200 [Plakobranchus ocellatus]|uniref:Uncharacterized protein n=1 Tax=Plakobranchus ocellatus TaxID=259542 RepID=A0AAV4B4H2_9GAST|nr:hypothetical protein PoB_004091200 [Plakobranchus ocellatus]